MTASLFGIGNSLNVNVNGTLIPQSFIGTAGQTVFNITGFTYVPGTNSLLVFINGQKQTSGRDFSETSSTSFTLSEGVIAGDFVDIIGFPEINLTAPDVSTITFQQAGGVLALVRSLLLKMRESYSVTDFVGCDPTGATDSLAAFNAAISTMPAAGGELFIPPGVYLLSDSWIINKRVTIRGCGTTESNNATAATILQKSATAVNAAIRVTAPGVKLENFVLQGLVGNVGDGISIEAGRCTLEDICSYGNGANGVRIGTDAGVNANLWSIRNLRAKGNTNFGLYISDKTSPTLPDCNGGILVGADLQLNGVAGCRLGNSALNTFINLVCQSNTGRGLSVSPDSSYNTFLGGDFESNGADEIHFEAASNHNVFFGGVITGSITDLGTANQFHSVQGSIYAPGPKLGNFNSAYPTVLDWYEEGEWTPELAFAVPGDLAVTYSAQGGTYQRIGNRVVVQFEIVTSAFTYTTASSALRITGLPWLSVNLATNLCTGSLQFAGITSAANPSIIPRVDKNTQFIALFGSGSGVAVTSIGDTQVPSGSSVVLVGQVEYQVAS